ncbi:AraC family transcriptional regulator [Anopheles sinensis]|uniref:AraC family transcriptional regulator n=1 Tax=Anopheles sinensis TaxID=74873 RepID=A0A084VQF7_ANOSI|nr:AraC family transcriptional regulator [Anopheles sinensis]
MLGCWAPPRFGELARARDAPAPVSLAQNGLVARGKVFSCPDQCLRPTRNGEHASGEHAKNIAVRSSTNSP